MLLNINLGARIDIKQRKQVDLSCSISILAPMSCAYGTVIATTIIRSVQHV
jgi:hypothetical protein